MLDTVLEYLPQMQKALVAGAVTAVLGLLAAIGVDGHMQVQDAVYAVLAGLVNGAATWLVKNSKK